MTRQAVYAARMPICATLCCLLLPTWCGAQGRDLGREVLPANDGWASSGTGTTGGSTAEAAQVWRVSNRREFVAALNNGVYPPPTTPSNTAKIIYVSGVIDGNVDDDNRPLSCNDYQRDGYTLQAYLTAYDPATFGRVNPTGAMETARVNSQMAQQARVRIRVGSNTTIVGMGRNTEMRGVWLDIRGTSGQAGSRTNIIIRNLNFYDTYDCFPQWAPTDGAAGNWNSQYDAISLRDADHVWIDHNTFADRFTQDIYLPTYFGRPYQIHDGLVDVTNASDLVTISWNRLFDHDKAMLFGSSDSATADVGKLRVTLHHNLFEDIGQRAPRVRYGQVHVYNNFYRLRRYPGYEYSLGAGVQSALVAQNNAFESNFPQRVDQVVGRFSGTAIETTGNLLNGAPVDLRAAYNAVSDPDLTGSTGFTPTLFPAIDPAASVADAVRNGAGPMNW